MKCACGCCDHDHDTEREHRHDHDGDACEDGCQKESGPLCGCGCEEGEEEEFSARDRICLTISCIALVAMLVCEWLLHIEPAALALAAIALVAGLVMVVPEAWESLKAKSIDINILLIVAVIGAIYTGAFEEAAAVLCLFSIGEYLESRAIRKSGDAIRALAELAPDTAVVVRDGRESEVPTDEVALGETVALKPGMRAPLDGTLIEGSSSFNDAAVTGESVPVEKKPGDTVFAASIAVDGACRMQTTSTVADSTVAKIADMVDAAQKRKSRREDFVKRFAKVYTPIVIVAAVLVALIPSLLLLAGINLGGSVNDWIYRACELLVISCPCAFVISTPVTVVSALAHSARMGVLVKGGAFFEEAASAQVIAFDKTGTLTKGEPQVVDAVNLVDGKEGTAGLLAAMAALEAHSTHPLAQAVAKRAQEDGADIAAASDLKEIAGHGVSGMVQGERWYVGSAAWATELIGDGGKAVEGLLDVFGDAVGTVLCAVSGEQPRLQGGVLVADALRDDSASVIERLSKGRQHLRTVMLTGDGQRVARSIADQAGVDEVHAELMPQDKTALVERLGTEYGGVAFVGDGINDAPSIASANVGIAMGGAGSDAALASADVVLMADDIAALPRFFDISRRCVATLKQNVWLAIGLKVLVACLVVVGVASMWMAILADTGVMLLVVLNGMRLLR